MATHRLLEQTFSLLRDDDPRNAAEHAFALAILYQREGNTERAIHYGRESISLFGQCQMETLSDCSARNTTIGGVGIPDLIHEEVVRARLQPLVL